MSAINAFLLKNNLRIAQNPCVSPDFCLDWHGARRPTSGPAGSRSTPRAASPPPPANGRCWKTRTGDCAWKLQRHRPPLERRRRRWRTARRLFPATWANLLKLKNLIQEHDPASTIFPTAGAKLGRSTLGVGARFTTLHWPAVEWAMSALEIGVTANQNSIPRELVYDVDAMLDGRLDTVPFPFIGTNVPEGHQGQSVEGMSHGCVLSKLKTGLSPPRDRVEFQRRPPADRRQVRHPRGRARHAAACSRATSRSISRRSSRSTSRRRSSAEAMSRPTSWRKTRAARGRRRPHARRCRLSPSCSPTVWPSLQKMKRRDEKYAAARAAAFTTDGRPRLPARAFDRRTARPDHARDDRDHARAVRGARHAGQFRGAGLRLPEEHAVSRQRRAARADREAMGRVRRSSASSIGFHSGSGKSAENYQVMGEVTGSRARDQDQRPLHLRDGRGALAVEERRRPALWRDWYKFTLEMAVAGAFSADATEQKMARIFITDFAGAQSGKPHRRLRLARRLPRRARGAAAVGRAHVLLRVQFPLRARRRRPAGEIRARRPHAGGLRPARALLRHQPGGPAALLEAHRGLPDLPRREHRPRLRRNAAPPRASCSPATPRSTRCWAIFRDELANRFTDDRRERRIGIQYLCYLGFHPVKPHFR